MDHASSLTPEKVRWIAHLARLDLNDQDLAAMTRHLGSIIDYVAQLRSVDTSGVEPLAHPLPVHNVFREDDPAPSLPVEEALAAAPDARKNARDERFFAVPAVLE
ncbi:MAG: Asp-tRNA(Asn)/Glu-tRNA(Gln) amidotransferase subunit GatC [Gemmataceae bacterium]